MNRTSILYSFTWQSMLLRYIYIYPTVAIGWGVCLTSVLKLFLRSQSETEKYRQKNEKTTGDSPRETDKTFGSGVCKQRRYPKWQTVSICRQQYIYLYIYDLEPLAWQYNGTTGPQLLLWFPLFSVLQYMARLNYYIYVCTTCGFPLLLV